MASKWTVGMIWTDHFAKLLKWLLACTKKSYCSYDSTDVSTALIATRQLFLNSYQTKPKTFAVLKHQLIYLQSCNIFKKYFNFSFCNFSHLQPFTLCCHIYELWPCQLNIKYKVRNWSPVKLHIISFLHLGRITVRPG